jgi:hypothetical protein
MGAKYQELKPEHIEFIEKQQIFFVATADENSRVNLSPKGLDSLRVVDNNLVVFLNKVGSGNETAAHIQYGKDNPRMTIMFCSFADKPMILRLYGKAVEILPSYPNFKQTLELFTDTVGARQLFALDIDLVQTSCGFGVPLFEFKGQRETLNGWAEQKGTESLQEYVKVKNCTSLDGKPIVID